MNKQPVITIISILLALVATTGWAQTFTPVVEDSVDFVITGTTTSTNDSVSAFPCAPIGQGVKFPIREGKFTVTGRQPRNTFFQIGDNARNDLRFIIEETPTHINLVTGEVKGSELQQRFIRCQLRERDIDKVAQPWWDSLSDEEKDRIITMREDGVPDATAKDSANYEKFEDFEGDRDALIRKNIRENNRMKVVRSSGDVCAWIDGKEIDSTMKGMQGCSIEYKVLDRVKTRAFGVDESVATAADVTETIIGGWNFSGKTRPVGYPTKG